MIYFHVLLFDKATYDKLLKDIPPSKLLTPAVVSERLKINGSLARRALKDLVVKGLIREVTHHNRQSIYTRSSTVALEPEKKEEKPKTGGGGKKKAEKKEEKVEDE